MLTAEIMLCVMAAADAVGRGAVSAPVCLTGSQPRAIAAAAGLGMPTVSARPRPTAGGAPWPGRSCPTCR